MIRNPGLALDRSAAGFLFVSVGETLENATICRFCGCVYRNWIVCRAVRTGMSDPWEREARSLTGDSL